MIRRSGFIRRPSPAEKRARTIARKAKAMYLGRPLVRYGDVLDAADDLWSVWVRASLTHCEMCGVQSTPAERQCAHGWSRDERATRFEPDNTFSLCPSCHRRHTPPGPAWDDWMRQHLGARRYQRVRLMAVAGGKLPESTLYLILLDAQQRIASLPSGERKAWALERQAAILARLAKRA